MNPASTDMPLDAEEIETRWPATGQILSLLFVCDSDSTQIESLKLRQLANDLEKRYEIHANHHQFQVENLETLAFGERSKAIQSMRALIFSEFSTIQRLENLI